MIRMTMRDPSHEKYNTKAIHYYCGQATRGQATLSLKLFGGKLANKLAYL